MMLSSFSRCKQPKLTLVGAGPGDPGLITVKAVKSIATADVILFDALVSEAILDMIPTGVPALSVGKRAGNHSSTQEEINELIVELAYCYGHVVRLKGGDPFVFGRGSEEIAYAAARGIDTAVIPGISSAIAVPASLNIPVTARGVSESFWVLTGTTRAGKLSEDIFLAARSTATVVILMGMNKLDDILSVFSDNGRSDVPVAIIQNGTMEGERSVLGTVATISTRAKEENISSPAVIVIGEVVRVARELNTMLCRTREHAAYQ